MLRTRYDAVAIGLHGLIAFGLLALIAIGLTMTLMGLGPMAKFRLYQLHKSIGITVAVRRGAAGAVSG